MKLALAFILAAMVATPAFAQQPPTPSQVALQIDNVINGWAIALEQAQTQITDLQKQLAAAKKVDPVPTPDAPK